jgi:phosphoglycolate phosphatase
MLAGQGLAPLSEQTVRNLIGRGIPHLVEQSLVTAGLALPCERLEPALRSFGDHYRRLNGQASAPYPGVVESLARLRAAKLGLACVTNKAKAFTQPLLDKTGLAPLLDAVVTADEVGRRKPDPAPFLRACELLQAKPEEACVIGDSSYDAEGARAAGCRVLLVTYGYNEGRDVRELDSDGVVQTFGEAVERLIAA